MYSYKEGYVDAQKAKKLFTSPALSPSIRLNVSFLLIKINRSIQSTSCHQDIIEFNEINSQSMSHLAVHVLSGPKLTSAPISLRSRRDCLSWKRTD